MQWLLSSVGQASRHLSSRVSENHRDCRLSKPTSVIANQCLDVATL